MGFFGAGNFGVVPGYLTERFPTVARAVGAGFAYHVGAGLGSFTPTLVGMLQDRGLRAADRDGRLHRRLRRAGDRAAVARSRNARQAVSWERLEKLLPVQSRRGTRAGGWWACRGG